MSFLDRIAAAVTPADSDEDRAKARQRVEELGRSHEWLQQIVAHHKQIEVAFLAAKNASAPAARKGAAKELGALLTGHSMAEEAVIYPAVAEHDGKTHATMAYEEQAMAKVQFALLEQMDPMSTEWLEKLEHIEGAVAQHVYQEESSWFPAVADTVDADTSEFLSQRYREEAQRYFG